MNGDQAAAALVVVLALTLPLSALLARRLPMGRTLRLALIWAAIIIGLLLVARWAGLTDANP